MAPVGSTGHQKPMMSVVADPRQGRADGVRLHHPAENGNNLKTCAVLVSVIFHLAFSDCA